MFFRAALLLAAFLFLSAAGARDAAQPVVRTKTPPIYKVDRDAPDRARRPA
jgi:hypothetical protein